MIRINPTKMLIGGDQTKAKAFLGPARSQMEILKNQMSFQNLTQGVRRVWLNEDTYVECIKCYNYQECRVWVRPQEVEQEAISAYSFILIITDRTGAEAFAWNLLENEQVQDTDGTVLGKKTFEEIKSDLIRLELASGNDLQTTYEPTLLEIKDTLYDSWWDCTGTPLCGDYNIGSANTDGFNGHVSIWPEYFYIDYDKMSLDDCVCEGNAKVSKLNHPVYYTGISSGGHDPPFDYFNSSITIPIQSHLLRPLMPASLKRPSHEWMIPYIEYLNPYTEIKEAWDKSAYIVKKQGHYHWSSVPESEKNKCELDPPEPAAAALERSFYWFHSIFGFEMHMNKDDGSWVFATKTNLDATIDFLYDTWDDDVFYEYFYGPVGEECYDISWPFIDFGFAEHEKGSVVFDFCTVSWGFGSQVMPMDSRYLGAVSGTRKQIFKIYTSYYEQMEEGSLALACFNALNDLRTEENLIKFSVNACLMEAAERHAIDQANNVTPGNWGHDGTDGSTIQSRVEDTDFLLWMKPAQINTCGENVYGQTGYIADPVDVAITGWKNSPGHWSNIINEEFTEIGVGVAWSENTLVFVTVFGGIPDRWSGFSALDTTELEAYMNTEFVWSGEANKYRIPKLYLA